MLKPPVTVHRKLAPWRRYAGLWLTALWLTFLVQPCAMAAITSPLVKATPGMGHNRPTVIEQDPCGGYSIENEGCTAGDFQSSQACCDSDRATSFDTVAASVQDIKPWKSGPPALNVAYQHSARKRLVPSAYQIQPERLPPGPSINNLFCVYLN